MPRSSITPGCTGIWSDAHIEPWARVAKFVNEYGSVAGIQIGHAGRKANTFQPWLRGDHDTPTGDLSWDVVGPSAIPFREGRRSTISSFVRFASVVQGSL